MDVPAGECVYHWTRVLLKSIAIFQIVSRFGNSYLRVAAVCGALCPGLRLNISVNCLFCKFVMALRNADFMNTYITCSIARTIDLQLQRMRKRRIEEEKEEKEEEEEEE